MKGVRLILLPNKVVSPSWLPAVGNLSQMSWHAHSFTKSTSSLTRYLFFLFVGCPSLLYVVVGAYPVRDILTSQISRFWSFRAELCASGVLDDPGLLGYFRHTWSAHTKISRGWEFSSSRYFVIFFGGKMRFTCCSCLGESHLQPHGQHAHSTRLPNSTHNQPLHV